MPELRKRKTPTEPIPAAPARKKSTAGKAAAVKTGNGTEVEVSKETAEALSVGSTVSLDNFGGEIETHDGTKTSLKQLIDDSKIGVILFTYPKASTPGCTQQVCYFRDAYTDFTGAGFSVYGLSRDSPKANNAFKMKQNLQYSLLCDPKGTLIEAIGFKKAPTSTTRGVFVINKEGKVLAAEPGGPAKTLEIVKELIATGITDVPKDEISVVPKQISDVQEEEKLTTDVAMPDVAAPSMEAVEPAPTSTDALANNAPATGEGEETKMSEDVEKADIAAEVADTAEKIDGPA